MMVQTKDLFRINPNKMQKIKTDFHQQRGLKPMTGRRNKP